MNSVLEFLWLAPRNLLILGVVAWRRWISPIYGDVCRYHPTCSAYGLGQLQQRGVLAGSVLTIWRIARCNPWSQGGVDEVKPGSGRFRITRAGFVLPKKKG